MKYKIIEADNYAELEKLINEMIKDKWMPLGGISFNIANHVWYCAQAMTTNNMSPSKWDEYTGE